MSETNEETIIPAVSEIDEPIRTQSQIQIFTEEVPSKEKREWLKWNKNYNFISYLLLILLILYGVDVSASSGQSSLKEPMFELLKTITLMVSGYVFAKGAE